MEIWSFVVVYLFATLTLGSLCLLWNWFEGAKFLRRQSNFTRVIHQQYRTSNSSTWPPEWRSLSQIWLSKHPDWQYRFWTDEDEAELFRRELPEFYGLYEEIPRCRQAMISRADLSTYAILYVHGGVYADLDTAPLVNLDSVLGAAAETTDKALAIVVNIERPDDGSTEVRGLGGLAQPYATDTDLMISTAPRHPFFYAVLKSIQDYLRLHKDKVCTLETKPKETTLDLMFLTAWGRLSMCVRSWSEQGLEKRSLEFLESLYSRDRVDGAVFQIAMHELASSSLEDLQSHPPPEGELGEEALQKWLVKSLSRQDEKGPQLRQLALPDLDYGQLLAVQQSDDMLILPIAASPLSLPKRFLRKLHLKCRDPKTGQTDLQCFEKPIRAALGKEFPLRDERHNLLVVFNNDAGEWEGSWSQSQQDAFHAAEMANFQEVVAAALPESGVDSSSSGGGGGVSGEGGVSVGISSNDDSGGVGDGAAADAYADDGGGVGDTSFGSADGSSDRVGNVEM